MGEIELTFIVPMDAVLQATTKLTQQNDKDSGINPLSFVMTALGHHQRGLKTVPDAQEIENLF